MQNSSKDREMTGKQHETVYFRLINCNEYYRNLEICRRKGSKENGAIVRLWPRSQGFSNNPRAIHSSPQIIAKRSSKTVIFTGASNSAQPSTKGTLSTRPHVVGE